MNAEQIRDLAEEQKQLAAHILDRVFLKTPPGYEHSAARDLVNFIVNAAILEISAVQKEVTARRAGNDAPD
jgi:hypothetical protein